MILRAAVVAIALSLAAPGCSYTDKAVGKIDPVQVETAYLTVSGILRNATLIAEAQGIITPDHLHWAYKELNRADVLINQGNIGLARFIYFQVQGKAPPEVVQIAEGMAGTTIADEIGVPEGEVQP